MSEEPITNLDAGSINPGYLDISRINFGGKYAATAVTQSEHPARAVARTVFAALIGLAAAWALIVEVLGLSEGIPWVAASLAIAGGITRVLAIPAVNTWLQTFLPWLAAAPKRLPADKDEDPEDPH